MNGKNSCGVFLKWCCLEEITGLFINSFKKYWGYDNILKG
jgi:hypothetical protein